MKPIERYQLFLIRKEKDKPDGRLWYRVKWSGYEVNFSVGYRVTIDKWSTETQRCINNTTHGNKKTSASEINRTIQRMEERINSIFYKHELNGTVPTDDDLRDSYNLLIGKKSDSEVSDMQDLFTVFIDTLSLKNSWTKETITKMNVIKNHLYRFNNKLTVDDISEDTLQGFVSYLLYDRKLRNTTTEKHYEFLCWFLRWAYDNEYIKSNAHITFNPRFKKVNRKEIIYLTWEELTHLYSFDFKSQPQLDRVRDVFCFCCFTGLRYSDVKNLKKDDIHENHIEIITQKTVDRLEIDLNNYSRAILEKYKDVELPNDSALPVISNQRMNDHLKTVGKTIGLDETIKQVYFRGNKRFEETHKKHELLTTHCGRRTFVVNALYLGIPAEVIMRWTGHSDFKAMEPYVEIVDDLKKTEMDKFNKF